MKQKTKESCWLILPMLSFSKNGDGTNEIALGWLTYIYWIKF